MSRSFFSRLGLIFLAIYLVFTAALLLYVHSQRETASEFFGFITLPASMPTGLILLIFLRLEIPIPKFLVWGCFGLNALFYYLVGMALEKYGRVREK